MKKTKILNLAFVALLTLNSCSNDDDDNVDDQVDLSLTAPRADAYVKTAALPQPILSYVSANYPDTTTHEAEVEEDGKYEVELSNGVELVFDAQGTFMGIDDDGEDNFGDEDISPADLPESIRTFVATHFSGANIEEAERENNGNYELELSNDVELIFDANGEFLGRVDDEDDEERDDDDIAISELPQSIIDYIATTYPDHSIIEAEREDDESFEVTLNNGMELLFDAEGNFLSVEDHNGDDDDDEDDD